MRLSLVNDEKLMINPAGEQENKTRAKRQKAAISELRDDKNFDRNFRQIGGLTALSRVLGFVRDICLAQFIGAGMAADAFLVAFKLPNLFRRLTADGALTNAFLPVFAHVRQEEGRGNALLLATEIQTILLLVLSVIVILAELFMPTVIWLLAPGFTQTPERFDAAVSLARVTVPYLPMISLVALWAAVTNAHNRFFGGAAAPVILNICLIGGALLIPTLQLATEQTDRLVMLAMPLAVSVLVAGICQMVLMQRMLARIDAAIIWRRPQISASGRRMWRAFLPAALGAGGLQLNLLIDMILASLVSVGAISWLYYADRIVQLPLGVIGIALGTALLPQLSKLESMNKKDDVAHHLAHSLYIGGFFALPAAVSVILICEPIIGGLFGYGAFGDQDVAMAAAALAAYGLGLPAFVINKVFQPAFFASDRGKLVLKISLISVAINLIGSLAMMPVLGHVGLALATGLASWFGVIIMAVILIKEGRLQFTALMALWPVLVASLVMGIALYGGYFVIEPWMMAIHYGAMLQITLLVAIGLISYFFTAYLLGAIPPFLFRRRKS